MAPTYTYEQLQAFAFEADHQRKLREGNSSVALPRGVTLEQYLAEHPLPADWETAECSDADQIDE